MYTCIWYTSPDPFKHILETLIPVFNFPSIHTEIYSRLDLWWFWVVRWFPHKRCMAFKCFHNDISLVYTMAQQIAHIFLHKYITSRLLRKPQTKFLAKLKDFNLYQIHSYRLLNGFHSLTWGFNHSILSQWFWLLQLPMIILIPQRLLQYSSSLKIKLWVYTACQRANSWHIVTLWRWRCLPSSLPETNVANRIPRETGGRKGVNNCRIAYRDLFCDLLFPNTVSFYFPLP
jgi:hypothetical protein